MSDDFLAKETEFHRLNRELQLKANNIMKEVDSITIRNGDDFDSNINTNAELCSSFTIKYRKTMDNTKNAMPEISKQLKESAIKVSDVSLIENFDNIKTSLKKHYSLENKAIINLLKGKIDMLHKELETIQLEHNKKCDNFKTLEMENKKLDDTQVKLCSQIASLNNTIIKSENINSDTLLKYQVLKNENTMLKKDLDNIKREVKVLNQQSTNYDIKLNRSVEINEKLKNALKSIQIEQKELKSQIKKLQEDKRLIIRNLEKQRSELVQAFQKQVLLIDNLKKQNTYLIANGQIHLTEENFAKLLDWKP